jgi:hypothetical protein
MLRSSWLRVGDVVVNCSGSQITKSAKGNLESVLPELKLKILGLAIASADCGSFYHIATSTKLSSRPPVHRRRHWCVGWNSHYIFSNMAGVFFFFENFPAKTSYK